MIYPELDESKFKEIDILMSQYKENYTGDNIEEDSETHRERLILLFRSTNTNLLKENIKEERINTGKDILKNVNRNIDSKVRCEMMIEDLKHKLGIDENFFGMEPSMSMIDRNIPSAHCELIQPEMNLDALYEVARPNEDEPDCWEEDYVDEWLDLEYGGDDQ